MKEKKSAHQSFVNSFTYKKSSAINRYDQEPSEEIANPLIN